MRNDVLYAYLPRWIVESPIPQILEQQVGPGAWNVYRALVEEETARNVLPDRVSVDVADLVVHTGLEAERVRTLIDRLRAAGFIEAQPAAGDDGYTVTISAPPPVAIDREALVARLRERQYAVRGVVFRYLDESAIRSTWREALDLYHAVFGAKINAAITDDLRALADVFDRYALREAFQEARRQGAKSLAWVATWLHRRADRDYIPHVARRDEGDPDDIVWRPDQPAGEMPEMRGGGPPAD